jgi:hypothetical protein
VLVTAMDSFQVAKRQHKENVKAQYTDKKGANGGRKTFFRASELGSADRKIIYGFFGHQLPKVERGAKNLRQLENGDFVHERYQSAWEEMGIVISMEARLSSKDDDYLKQFPWEWAGHYDGELDMHLVRAHALGYAKIDSVLNEESGKYEIQVELDDAYANSIGIFDAEGNVADDYEQKRPRMVADIKTMNPWGFKKIKYNGDVSNIAGYLDQISFYMYMLGTPYGSIYIESKDNNDVCEVQIVWTDFYEDTALNFTEDIHGKQSASQVRVTINNERFFGGEALEGVVPRINRLWGLIETLQKADAEGDMETIARLVPGRCEGVTKPDAFPCSWGHKTGEINYCEYYDHCWNGAHHGLAVHTVAAWEQCPEELVWSFTDEVAVTLDGENTEPGVVQEIEVRIDSRKVPKGVDMEGFMQLVDIGALDYTKFMVDEAPSEDSALPPSVVAEIAAAEAEKTAINGTKNMFSETGELNIGKPTPPTEAVEFRNAEEKRAVICTNCGKESTFNRLGAGNKHTCMHCKHINQVVKP